MTWLIVVGYALIGVGVARHTLKRVVVWNERYHSGSYHWSDVDLVFVPFLGGVFWPLALVWFLLVRPVGTVVAPWFGAWFMGPARKVARTVR